METICLHKSHPFLLCLCQWLSLPVESLNSEVLPLLGLKDLVRLMEALQSSLKSSQLISVLFDQRIVSERVLLSKKNQNWFEKNNTFLENVDVGSISLKSIPQIFKHTRVLDVSQCNFFSTPHILEIIAQCSLLESFTAADYSEDPFVVTDDVGSALIKYCPHIKELHFTDCRCMSAHTFIQLSQAFPSLQCLSLTSTWFDVFMEVDELETILQNCPCLMKLHLERSVLLTDANVSVISANCPHLTSLSLVEMYSLTDSGIEEIFTAFPNLVHINLTSTDTLTSQAFVSMANLCPKLETVVLVGCEVNDDAIRELVHRCVHLKVLNLCAAPSIADGRLHKEAENCLQLVTQLIREGCENITNAMIVASLQSM